MMNPLKTLIDEEMHKMLFMNLEDIVPIHQDLLREMEDSLKVYNRYTAKISQPLLNFAPKIKSPYYRYCL